MIQLEIEKTALAKENDNLSRERLQIIITELTHLGEKSKHLKLHWQNEKDVITQMRSHKKKIETLRNDSDRYEREGNLNQVAEIRYGSIPELQSNIDSLNSKLKEIQKDQRLLKEEITEEEIAEVISSWTGIPVSKMLASEKAKLIQMEEELNKKVIGQQVAIETLSDAVRRSRSGLADPNKPVGSFLFMGPTGVGKTETCKVLAEFLFDNKKSLVRLDMSEYMEKHSVAKLIGAPPGYIGYEEGGYLTEQIRRRPYSVILLDEIEKADPDVFNILLQIMDDGQLTDSQGRTVNFKHTMIIMTSNIGSTQIQESQKTSLTDLKTEIMGLLNNYFRPEFLNRLDDIIIFHSLTQENISQIVELQLSELKERLKEKKISISLTDKAKKYLSDQGFSTEFGARLLKRVIQKKILNQLAVKLLGGDFKEGDHLIIDFVQDAINFKKSTTDVL